MGKLTTGRLRQDDYCHWFLIPDEKIEAFDKLAMILENTLQMSDRYDDLIDEFTNIYGQYMLGGGPYKLAIIMPE